MIVHRTNMAALYPRGASAIESVDGKFRILELPANLHRPAVRLHAHLKCSTNRAIFWLSEIIRQAPPHLAPLQP